jgi:hypothetical protein
MSIKLNLVYVKTGLNEYAEYQGGANFLNGHRRCSQCQGNMHRDPIGVLYIKTEGGKILVNSTNKGRLVKINTTPDYQWTCQECNYALPTESPE